MLQISATQYLIGSAFNAGLAYYIHKKHPRWALFFAFNAVAGAILAAGASSASSAGLAAPAALPNIGMMVPPPPPQNGIIAR